MISLTEKVKSHLLPDLTAKDRAREYSFYVDDRLKMQRLSQPEVRDGQAPQVFFIAIYP